MTFYCGDHVIRNNNKTFHSGLEEIASRVVVYLLLFCVLFNLSLSIMERVEDRNYGRKRTECSNDERLALGELVEKYKKEFDAEVEKFRGKERWDAKRKKHVPIKPRWGPFSRAAREFYTNLSDVKHDDPMLDKATKFAKRCHSDLARLRDPSCCPS